MAKSYAALYNPDKSLPTTRYRNQGYSNEEIYDIDQRRDSYKKWKQAENKVTKNQLKQEETDQIGSVNSSWLTSLGYNTATGEAAATFHGTSGEFFYKMPYKQFLEWLNAPSKGKWLNDHNSIKKNYRVVGGSGGSGFEKRISSFTKSTKSGSRSDGTKQAKARVKKYLAKYR